jgi:DNA polymerase-1
MLVGAADMLSRLWERTAPRAMFVGFDTPRTPTYRNELLPQYQSGRDFVQDDEFMAQLDRVPVLVEALGLPFAKQGGYEADDFIAAAVRAEEEAGGTALVFSNDRDLFQLASARTMLLSPRRGASELERVGPAEVRERYGIDPEQVADFIALRGDPSDRIPGARGIGPVKAAALLGEHGSLEEVLRAGRFSAEADALRTYRRIAIMQADAPIPPLPDTTPDWDGGATLADGWGLTGLANRLRSTGRTVS